MLINISEYVGFALNNEGMVFIKAFLSILKVQNIFHNVGCCKIGLSRVVTVRHDMKEMTFGFDTSLPQACKEIWHDLLMQEIPHTLLVKWKCLTTILSNFFYKSLSLQRELIYRHNLEDNKERTSPADLLFSICVINVMGWKISVKLLKNSSVSNCNNS